MKIPQKPEEAEQKAAAPEKKMRARSPAYPFISLGDAIELIRKVWDAQRKQEAHIDSTLKAMGYASRNGASLRAIGALNHYGLIVESGSGDERKFKVSEQAQDILHLQPDDSRRIDALKKSALAPAIHAALWERYGAHLPDDKSITPFLLREKGYNEEAIPIVLNNYRSTFTLANLDKNEHSNVDEIDDSAARHENHSGKVEKAGVASKPFVPMSSGATTQEMPILVGPGKVARIPFPITEEDFGLLMDTLNLWKKKLVKGPEPVTQDTTNAVRDE